MTKYLIFNGEQYYPDAKIYDTPEEAFKEFLDSMKDEPIILCKIVSISEGYQNYKIGETK